MVWLLHGAQTALHPTVQRRHAIPRQEKGAQVEEVDEDFVAITVEGRGREGVEEEEEEEK